MNILCIETSGGNGTLALQHGEQILTAEFAAPQVQAEELIPQIDALLRRAGVGLRGLDAIGFGCGPGSFIGLRLGSCVAQGLAAAADIGLAPVSSMAALACGIAGRSAGEQRVLVCLDARMHEVYWAAYQCADRTVVATAPERLLAPQDVLWPAGGGWIAAGSGFAAYAELRDGAAERGFELLTHAVPRAIDVLPFAAAAARAGALVAAAHWHGDYLRDETAWKTKE